MNAVLQTGLSKDKTEDIVIQIMQKNPYSAKLITFITLYLVYMQNEQLIKVILKLVRTPLNNLLRGF